MVERGVWLRSPRGLLKPILQFEDIGNVALKRFQHIGFVIKGEAVVNEDVKQPCACNVVENCRVVFALVKSFFQLKQRRMEHFLDISPFQEFTRRKFFETLTHSRKIFAGGRGREQKCECKSLE